MNEVEQVASEALQVERDTILKLGTQRVINDEVLRRFQHELPQPKRV